MAFEFPVPNLTFARLPDVTVAGTAIADMLDAIFTALSATTDYRGTSVPSTHRWVVTKRQVTSVTNAVTCDAPTGTPLTLVPTIIFAGRASVNSPTAPTMLAPDTAFNSTLMMGINKNSGSYNSWDAALPMTSGQWSGYYRLAPAAANAVGTIVRAFVSSEVIFIQIIQSATVQYWGMAGAILQPHTGDTNLCCEADGRIYGMVSCGSSPVPATWLYSAHMFSYSTTASAPHAATFQPGSATLYSCGRRTLYSSTGGAVAELQDAANTYVGDSIGFGKATGNNVLNGTRLGTLRGVFLAGGVQSGRYLRNGATDLYHYVSVDTSAPAAGFMFPAVA
jgi:hypothetical protein